ncbi:MAG: glycosyltransferase 87 family protein [Gammaproteobacteria bacterium]
MKNIFVTNALRGLIVLFILSTLWNFAMSSYFGHPVAQAIYGATNDAPGWADPVGVDAIVARPCPELKYGSETCAKHVFGDFSYLYQLVQTKIPWAESGENTNLALPAFITWVLFHMTHSYWVSLGIFLALTIASFLYPVIRISRLQVDKITFAIVILSGWSIIYTIDRGNAQGLLFAPMWIAYEGFRSKSDAKSVIGLTLCFVIKIHSIFLLLPFLIHRRFRSVGASLFCAVLLNLGLLRIMTPRMIENIRGFFMDMVGMSKVNQVGPLWPDYYRNLSIGGFFGSVIETVQIAINKPHVIEVFIQDWWSPVIPAIIGLIITIPLACRKDVPNWTIFVGATFPMLVSSPRAQGYTATVIVFVFLIVINEGEDVSFLNSSSRKLFLIAFLMCESQNFYIPRPIDPNVGQPITLKSFLVPVALFILIFTAYRSGWKNKPLEGTEALI